MYIHKIVPNLYRDSVSLMQLSAALERLPGIEQASAIMATPANLELLREARLLNGEKPAASANDLLLALRGKSEAALQAALAHAVATLDTPASAPSGGAARRAPLSSLRMALDEAPAANLALVSVPGEYAAAEAMKALRLGLNVMLFSDNVSGADEVALKRDARRRGLLVMGPDCGTAIIDGVPLGFANAVRRGAIGVVGASGTGTQMVTSLVHRAGAGISHAIGTGGHDLSHEVGGITMLAGLEKLARDPQTKVIVLISKPPAAEVAQAVLAHARRAGKPVVVNFIGSRIDEAKLHGAQTLEEAAAAAVALSRGSTLRTKAAAVKAPRIRFKGGQRYIRGLYSGGTFCYEACALIPDAWSNAPLDPKRRIKDVWKSRDNTLIDLGDDQFTRGRPHPMIDHRLRNERLLQEAADPGVAVILMDVVLGYGAHPDPAAAMAPALRRARDIARKAKRPLVIVGFVCGTDEDPQGLARQEAALRDAGMLLESSSARAARLALKLVS